MLSCDGRKTDLQAEDLPTCQEVSEGVRAQKRGQDFIDMLHLLHLMHRPPSGRSYFNFMSVIVRLDMLDRVKHGENGD